ncbi:MAG: type IV pilus secretin PilQ [Desulfuromonadaceae bacterium]|nr:type IV pilus secretin PilQ [Desulfuromonadaceae bacterium]
MTFFYRHTRKIFITLPIYCTIIILLFTGSCLADDLTFDFGTTESKSVTINSEKNLAFSSFKVNNPYRLVIDVKNCDVAPTELLNKNRLIPKILINKIGTTTRIVLEPLPDVQLITKQDSPRSITVLSTESVQMQSITARSPVNAGNEPGTNQSDLPITANTLVIKDNTISLGTTGLVNSITTYNFPESNKFIFVLANTNLSIKHGLYKLDFLNLTGMDVEQQGENAKITFYVKAKAVTPNYFSVKDGNALHIRFFLAGQDAETGDNKENNSSKSDGKFPTASRFTGQKISLDFDNADIRHIIRLLSEVNKKNYLITDAVKGTISLKLLNVPWDQALELILKNHELVTIEDGDVTEILTYKQEVEREKKKMERDELEDIKNNINKAQEEIGICSVQLRHASAIKVLENVKSIIENKDAKVSTNASRKQLQGSYDASGNVKTTDDNMNVQTNASENLKVVTDEQDDLKRMLHNKTSVTGNMIAEQNSNRIVIRDLPSRFAGILKILSIFDVADQQVMIEARIVSASTEFVKSLGVQWGTHFRDGSASLLGINSLDSGFGGIASSAPTSGTLGSYGMATGVSFGKLANNINLDLRLSAAETAFMAKTISTPRIAVTYGETANIKDGKQIPYNKLNTNTGQTTTEFKDASLSLDVTPTITPSCDVIMNVAVTNDAPGALIGGVLPINTKSAKTKLSVKNGETVVIGGTYIADESESEVGVPFLMNMPVIGYFFKSIEKVKTSRELLIFITPKLIDKTCNGSNTISLKHEKLECSID